MEHWRHGGREAIGTWARDILLAKAAPFFRLGDRRRTRAPIWEADFSPERRHDSGVLDFRARLGAAPARDMRTDLTAVILGFARAEDSRQFERRPDEHSRAVQARGPSVELELASGIELISGVQTSVVGPGGRAVLYRQNDGRLSGEIVVRHRENELAGDWRDVQDILRRVNEASTEIEELRISATYGYFELSKYELQLVMRPAFIFVVDGYSSYVGVPDWRQTLVEPATYNSHISDEQGLGSWVE